MRRAAKCSGSVGRLSVSISVHLRFPPGFSPKSGKGQINRANNGEKGSGLPIYE